MPWAHNLQTLGKLDGPELRRLYAAPAVAHGWSRAGLANQIMSQLHLRAGNAQSNFAELLPTEDSGLIQQVANDPYNLEFLTLERDVAERDLLEAALVTLIQEFLLEFGTGLASIGRQHRLDVASDEFFIDLSMFHIPTAPYVVIELKATKLTAAGLGRLSFYVAAVGNLARTPSHADTIGLLLCSTRNEQVVRYARGRSTSTLEVAGYRVRRTRHRRTGRCCRPRKGSSRSPPRCLSSSSRPSRRTAPTTRWTLPNFLRDKIGLGESISGCETTTQQTKAAWCRSPPDAARHPGARRVAPADVDADRHRFMCRSVS